jgi:hypothetical protein
MYQPLSHERRRAVRLAAGAGGVDSCPDMMPTRSSAAPLPQATAITLTSPPAASNPLTPIHLQLGHCPGAGSDSGCPGPPRLSSRGVTQTTRSATHPVHLGASIKLVVTNCRHRAAIEVGEKGRCDRSSSRLLTCGSPVPCRHGVEED